MKKIMMILSLGLIASGMQAQHKYIFRNNTGKSTKTGYYVNVIAILGPVGTECDKAVNREIAPGKSWTVPSRLNHCCLEGVSVTKTAFGEEPTRLRIEEDICKSHSFEIKKDAAENLVLKKIK